MISSPICKMKKGFTIVEMVVVLAILGVGIGLFYSIFYVNWSATEQNLRLIDLQEDADSIIENISFDAKFAESFVVSANGKSVVLSYSDPIAYPDITYTFNVNSQIVKTVAGSPLTKVISERMDFNGSSFENVGNFLRINLLLFDDIFGRRIEFRVTTQLFPRNLAQ